MVALRSGGPLAPQLLVEQAEESGIPEAHRALAAEMRQRWVVGTPDTVAEQVAALAARYAVDEVMVHPVAGAVVGTPADRAPAREATLALLAEAFGAHG
jgi:alkanesulfonate monooxygenase SsuD/methylene tetrahydromethanopterin reductase-like flavin-dependent oxidoreductase (luciferase family)